LTEFLEKIFETLTLI